MPEVAAQGNPTNELGTSETVTSSTTGEATNLSITHGEQDATSSETAPSTTGTEDLPAKKKRTAERQITKDDYDAGDDGENDEDVGEIKHGFKRASAEVLAKRKIVRVKRPTSVAATTAATSSNNPFSATELNGAAKKEENSIGLAKQVVTSTSNPFAATSLTNKSSTSNPFASTTLTPSSKEATLEETDEKEKKEEPGEDEQEGETSTSKRKVFGSGSSFSGFKTAVSSSGFGFGTGSSSSGFSGFGKVTNGSNGVSGFGAVASAGVGFGKTSTSGLFGSATSSTGFSSASTKSSTAVPSLFQTGPGAPAFSFGASSKNSNEKDADEDDDVDVEEEVDVTIGDNAPVVNLPEQVQLKTGEEDEEVIHDGRCKSFHWVPKPPDEDESAEDTDTKKKATPSVKPSEVFQAVISTKSKDGITLEKKNEESSDKEDQTNGEKEKTETDVSEVTNEKKEESKPVFKWKELGVGPMKILSSTSNDGKYRLVQRRESTPNGPATKVILNVPLWKESTTNRTAPKYLTLKTLVDGKVESYSFRFKDSSDASYFQHYLSISTPKAKSAFAPAD